MLLSLLVFAAPALGFADRTHHHVDVVAVGDRDVVPHEPREPVVGEHVGGHPVRVRGLAPRLLAYATAHKLWPDIEVRGSSQPLDFRTYLDEIGDHMKVLNMLVGDTQRIWVYAERGFAIPQEVPTDVWRAYDRLRAAGFDRRLIND